MLSNDVMARILYIVPNYIKRLSLPPFFCQRTRMETYRWGELKKQQVASIPQEAEEERKRRQKCSFLTPKIMSTNRLTIFRIELRVFWRNHQEPSWREIPEEARTEREWEKRGEHKEESRCSCRRQPKNQINIFYTLMTITKPSIYAGKMLGFAGSSLESMQYLSLQCDVEGEVDVWFGAARVVLSVFVGRMWENCPFVTLNVIIQIQLFKTCVEVHVQLRSIESPRPKLHLALL